jgi:hypothetical protein
MLECKLTQKSRVNISGSKEKRGNLWHSNRVLGRVLTQLPDPSLVWFLILHHKSTYNDYFRLMLHFHDIEKKLRWPNRSSGEDFSKDLLVALNRLPGPCPERGAEVAQGPARRQDLPGYHTHPRLLQAELIQGILDICRKPCANTLWFKFRQCHQFKHRRWTG